MTRKLTKVDFDRAANRRYGWADRRHDCDCPTWWEHDKRVFEGTHATHYPDPDPLYVPEPGTDDEPWPVVVDAEARATFVEWRKRFADANADPPADRRSFALAVLLVALVVVAIVWRR